MVDWPDPLVEDYLSIIRNLALLAEELTATSGSAEDVASTADRTEALARSLQKAQGYLEEIAASNAAMIAALRSRPHITFAEIAARIEVGV